jgi:A/G-specific adenine glycosylase
MNSTQKTILNWYKQNKRDLPWRQTDDPYKITVSEIMLQQTQVPRVIEKYNEFLKKFPTIKKLAQASPADVIDTWAGLGYNRRALHLHKFAQQITNNHKGIIPTDAQTLQTLPGIGPYTSNAIRAFAFNLDGTVIDINIKRIYSRIFFSGEGTNEQLAEKATVLTPKNKNRDWNNALMDFGSSICTDKPQCHQCPLTNECTAYQDGHPEKYVKPKTQSKFIGSNRYYRSLIIKELRKSKDYTTSVTHINKLKPKDKSDEWFITIINSLEKDGLIKNSGGKISLPH